MRSNEILSAVIKQVDKVKDAREQWFTAPNRELKDQGLKDYNRELTRLFDVMDIVKKEVK